jgi:hypothetical protein
MDSPYTWHPGAVCIAPQWAARVDLLRDESLSSWIARTAIGNGCDRSALLSALWPRVRWDAGDVHRKLDDKRIERLARQVGIPAEILARSSLALIASAIQGTRRPPQGAWPWITTAGPRQRALASTGAFCPVCLHNDDIPHLRLQWRLTWHTACAVHACTLSDCCPHCERSPRSDYVTADGGGLGHCTQCRGVLGAKMGRHESTSVALSFQQRTDAALRDRSAEDRGERLSPSGWFTLLNIYLRGLRTAIRAPWNPWANVFRSLGVSLPVLSPGERLESMPIDRRAQIIDALAPLAVMGCDDTGVLLADAGVSQQCAAFGKPLIDHPLRRVLQDLPDRPRPSRRKPTRRRLPEPATRTQVAWKLRMLLGDEPRPAKAPDS